MTVSLFVLSADYQAVLAACDQAGDPDSEKAFEDTLAALKGEIEVKLDNCAAVLETMQAEADALQHEEQRLKARRAAIESNQSRLKSYMQEQMEACNIEKSKGARFTCLVQLNPPKVVIDDEAKIPNAYWRMRRELARDVISADLKAEKVVEGCHLTRERSLRVR